MTISWVGGHTVSLIFLWCESITHPGQYNMTGCNVSPVSILSSRDWLIDCVGHVYCHKATPRELLHYPPWPLFGGEACKRGLNDKHRFYPEFVSLSLPAVFLGLEASPLVLDEVQDPRKRHTRVPVLQLPSLRRSGHGPGRRRRRRCCCHRPGRRSWCRLARCCFGPVWVAPRSAAAAAAAAASGVRVWSSAGSVRLHFNRSTFRQDKESETGRVYEQVY